MDLSWHNSADPDLLAALASVGAPMPMQQHPTYGRVLAALGRSVRVGVWRDAGAPVALAQVVARPGLALISRGPLWVGAMRGAAELLRSAATLRGVTISTPEQSVRGPGLIPLMTARHEAVWHLPGDAARLRAGLGPKWRNKLTRAERTGGALTIRVRATARADWLYAAEGAQRRARRYRALPPAFAAAWQAVAPGDVRLYAAWLNGEPVAGILILAHRPWASYHLAWSGATGRRLNAHRLLLWRAALDLQDDGYAALALGDVNTEDAPGLASFKIGTGAEVRPLGETMLVLPRITPRRSGSPVPSPRIPHPADGT